MDRYSEQTIALRPTCFDLVPYPWAARGLGSDQNNSNACPRQLPIYPTLDRGIALALQFFPVGSVQKSGRLAISSNGPAIPDLPHPPGVTLEMEAEKHTASQA
jgi:hypothetical protein